MQRTNSDLVHMSLKSRNGQKTFYENEKMLVTSISSFAYDVFRVLSAQVRRPINSVSFNLFQDKPWFSHACSTSLVKTLWEKDQMLVTSNFSSSHRVFYPFGEHSATFIKFKIVVCKLFEFEFG